MNEQQRDDFLEHMRAGMRRGAAAELLGLTRMGVLDYIASNDDFRLAVEDAEGMATEHIEEALYQAAVSGSVPAAKIWLELKRRQGTGNLPVLYDPDVPTDDAEFDELLRLTTED